MELQISIRKTTIATVMGLMMFEPVVVPTTTINPHQSRPLSDGSICLVRFSFCLQRCKLKYCKKLAFPQLVFECHNKCVVDCL